MASLSRGLLHLLSVLPAPAPIPLPPPSPALCQGNLELYTLYYLIRVLAAGNAVRLAEYEGRDVPSRPDQLVSAQEAAIVQKTQADALSFVGFSVFFTSLLFTALTTALIWQLGGAAVDVLGLAGAPPDPLAF